ncbi:MAG: guanylate kinase [Hyphomicrobiaceae bacterium]|nr:guanylate kinase [Hyphomicrobiaceae bacterium]
MNNQKISAKRQGVMLVVSSPSGAGKTTLCKMLLEQHDDLVMSVSATTRPPREGEKHGSDYFFISPDEFKHMQDENLLLESAAVFGNHYGTPREPVERILNEGKDILFDIDWQGAAQLSAACGENICKIFILPPSGRTLEKRLTGRATDSFEVVAKRMSAAAREIDHWSQYDYVIINDDLDIAWSELNAILVAERHKTNRLVFLPEFVQTVLDELE